jgi:hypothetical protein
MISINIYFINKNKIISKDHINLIILNMNLPHKQDNKNFKN